MDKTWVDKIRNICAIVLVAQIFRKCDADRTLNLNDWLLDFENCYVNIVGLKDFTFGNIDYGIFKYPVLHSNKVYKGYDANTRLEFNTLRKRNFCAVLAFVIPRYSFADYVFILQYLGNYFCSKPAHGHVDDDDVNSIPDLSYKYKWTSCIFVLVLPEVTEGTRQDQNGRNQLLTDYLELNKRDVQAFIFGFREIESTSLRISKVEYICQQCMSFSSWVWEIQCPLQTCRRQMEAFVAKKTA